MGKNVEKAVQQYRAAAAGTRASTSDQANLSHDRMHALYKELRKCEEGRRAICRLLDDSDLNVRCWAAAHSLEWDPVNARQTLESIRDAGGECAFEARLVIEEFDAGRLTFNY